MSHPHEPATIPADDDAPAPAYGPEAVNGAGLVVLILGAAFFALRSGRAESNLAAQVCNGAACAGRAGVAAAPAENVAVATAPCPYCGQDPARWRQLTTVPPPPISGQGAAVVEGACGRLVYGLKQDEQHPPASIAKIVTALVVAGRARLDDRVPVNINGWDLAAADGSSIAGLVAGTNLSVEELLYALLLPSGNDAAEALADYLGGQTRFVDLMNETVRRGGLSHSHFANPDGRDAPSNYTSALDIALLGRQLMADPALRPIAGAQTRTASWDQHVMWNTNYFVYGIPGAIGVKFGYTEGANETIVGAAARGGRELYVSVLDSDYGYLDAKHLIEWAYANTPPSC